MAFTIEEVDGKWHWSCSNSAYGAAAGEAPTRDAAVVDLAIAEAMMFDTPFPPTVIDRMRAQPEIFARDWDSYFE